MLLLDAKQKKQMVGIVFMMLIGGILESLGIALIAPIMEILIKPELIDESKALSFLYYSVFNYSENLSDPGCNDICFCGEKHLFVLYEQGSA